MDLPCVDVACVLGWWVLNCGGYRIRTPWGWYKFIETYRNNYNINIVQTIYIYIYIYVLCIVCWNKNYIQDARYIHKNPAMSSDILMPLIPNFSRVIGAVRLSYVSCVVGRPVIRPIKMWEVWMGEGITFRADKIFPRTWRCTNWALQ
jgi:hypothetical protein